MNLGRSLTTLGPRYLALWIGQTVSQFGTYVAWLTLPLLVADLQQAAGDDFRTFDFALTYALETAPTLFAGLVAGVLLDRWHLRPVMIATDLLRASAFFYLAGAYGSYGIEAVFLVAFLVGTMTTFFDGALYTMIPSLVGRRRLADANSFVAASQQANFALGVLAAGILALATGGPGLGLFINGATFVVSAICLYWVGRVDTHRAVTERTGFFREAADGIRYIWTESRLRITTIAAAVPNFVMGFVEGAIVVIATVVIGAANEAQIGLLAAAMGVGGIVGALYAPRMVRALGLGRTLTFGMAIAGIGLLIFMFTSYGWIALALNVGWMIGVSLINVSLATIRQDYAKDGMLGRVVSASRAIGWATLPIGALIGGWIGDSEDMLVVVARVSPILLVLTAVWLFTTVVWSDTFGPNFEGRHTREREKTVET